MQIIDYKNITEKLPDCAATIGFFDGVHQGHRFLLENLKEIAAKRDQKTLTVTFREHPNTVLQSQPTKKLLNTFDEKISLIADLGIDFCLALDFSEEISEMSAAQFIEFLNVKYSVKTLLVGYDNRFGHNRVENFEDYRQSGKKTGVEVVRETHAFVMGDGLEISSSKIRHLLQDGNVEKANQLLGYQYFFSGTVVRGQQIGNKIGFPTANIELDCKDKIMPLQGAFSVGVMLDNQTFRGMMNIGYNPTRLEYNPEKTIEVNIFDFDKNIYGKKIKVAFLKKIRNEQKFASLEELKKQLEKDKIFASL